MKFSIKDFSSKCDQIRRKLRIWSHLLRKSLMENFIFCAVQRVSLGTTFNVTLTSGKHGKTVVNSLHLLYRPKNIGFIEFGLAYSRLLRDFAAILCQLYVTHNQSKTSFILDMYQFSF